MSGCGGVGDGMPLWCLVKLFAYLLWNVTLTVLQFIAVLWSPWCIFCLIIFPEALRVITQETKVLWKLSLLLSAQLPLLFSISGSTCCGNPKNHAKVQ